MFQIIILILTNLHTHITLLFFHHLNPSRAYPSLKTEPIISSLRFYQAFTSIQHRY